MTPPDRQAIRILLRGRVQGLGVRPAIARAAAHFHLGGSVRNTRAGLEMEVEGEAAQVAGFLTGFVEFLPLGANFSQRRVDSIPLASRQGFQIVASGVDEELIGAVPVDRAICQKCLTETKDPANRRFGYAFTSCASCGPRYSILERMPYDRITSAMRDFPRCAACEAEYQDIHVRRFHAETSCCPACGPRLWATDGRSVWSESAHALKAVARTLTGGGIAAIKGIGGYQLLANARDSAAVRRLRERKRRPAKPLAVMVLGLAEAERQAVLSDAERVWLTSAENPIVVVRRREDATLVAGIAPGMREIGLFLPSSALHYLLLEHIGGPVVCTSGNPEGEPLEYLEGAVEQRLSGIADIFLHHDRHIVNPIDDSVVRLFGDELCLLRCARGFAPGVFPGPETDEQSSLLAVGGELKSAIALWNGREAVLGPHLGDLSNESTCERWTNHVKSLSVLHALRPAALARDYHPDYLSTRAAEAMPGEKTPVQHHHAHAAAVLWEHERYDDTAVALIWDGAGFGDDGLIWGGECLLASLASCERVAHLLPFPLVGGDAAVREPWRVAAALALQAGLPDVTLERHWSDISSQQLSQLAQIAERPQLAPRSTSMGRLFDAVASLAFRTPRTDFEGQLAMQLESAYDPSAQGAYHLDWTAGETGIDWRPLIRQTLVDALAGESVGIISARFHRALADIAARISEHFSHLPLVTGGGVFQNAVLNALLAERLGNRASGWLRPRLAPPGDGGLALGQVAVACARGRRT